MKKLAINKKSQGCRDEVLSIHSEAAWPGSLAPSAEVHCQSRFHGAGHVEAGGNLL